MTKKTHVEKYTRSILKNSLEKKPYLEASHSKQAFLINIIVFITVNCGFILNLKFHCHMHD